MTKYVLFKSPKASPGHRVMFSSLLDKTMLGPRNLRGIGSFQILSGSLQAAKSKEVNFFVLR